MRTFIVSRLPFVAACMLAAGCGNRDVLAEVGATRVTKADLRLFMDNAGARYAGEPTAALGALVQRARLAEAARRAGLAESAELQARLAASRREILAGAYLDKNLESAVAEEALRKRYATDKDHLTRRRIHIAHIMARPAGPGKEAREAARSRIVKAYARLAAGERFEKVAADASDDESTRQRGGDLGVLVEGQVDATFFNTAAALKLDEVSPPVESPYAFHLLKALDAPSHELPTFDEIRGRLAADSRRDAELRLAEKLKTELPAKVYADRLDLKGPSAPATTPISHP